MTTKYFIDYYRAEDYAKDHNLVECEYGDTGIKMGEIEIGRASCRERV